MIRVMTISLLGTILTVAALTTYAATPWQQAKQREAEEAKKKQETAQGPTAEAKEPAEPSKPSASADLPDKLPDPILTRISPLTSLDHTIREAAVKNKEEDSMVYQKLFEHDYITEVIVDRSTATLTAKLGKSWEALPSPLQSHAIVVIMRRSAWIFGRMPRYFYAIEPGMNRPTLEVSIKEKITAEGKTTTEFYFKPRF